MAIPVLRDDRPHLADVVPAALSALGVPDLADALGFRDGLRSVCVLLIDGLGAELLDVHASDAPTLSAMRSGTLQVGFPSTTAAGLAAIGTGTCSGEHGMVGYSFALPEVGVLNSLRWRTHPWGADLRDAAPPEAVQPSPTTFERADAAGVACRVVSAAQHTESGLTRAVLRGAPYIGVQALGDLGAAVLDAMAHGGFCYGYHADLDMLGHLYGPGSAAWRLQLRQVDRLVESLVDGLAPGGMLAVVADHGMVGLDDSVVDYDACPPLQEGVQAVGGEARARHVYARDGAAPDVLAAWRETLGERAWVVDRDKAIAAGWFGHRLTDVVRSRIGDVVVAATGRSGVLRREFEPLESSLPGQHGSLTPAELLVPLALAYG